LGGGVSRKADGGGSNNWVGGWATLLASPFKERWHEVPERLPSPVGEGVTAGDGWGNLSLFNTSPVRSKTNSLIFLQLNFLDLSQGNLIAPLFAELFPQKGLNWRHC